LPRSDGDLLFFVRSSLCDCAHTPLLMAAILFTKYSTASCSGRFYIPRGNYELISHTCCRPERLYFIICLLLHCFFS